MSAPQAITKRAVVEIIKSSVQEFAKRLPQGIDPTKWTMQLATVVQRNPDLLNCEPASLLLAAYEAAELGVNLSPSLQLGYIIPYGQKANFQIGYRGMIQKAYESKAVRNFFAEVVYKNDKFERQFAPKRNLFHAPADGDRGEKIGAYALIEFIDGHLEFEYMTVEQIERRRNHSKQPNSIMWSKFWEEAYRKTPIRGLFKRIPLIDPGLEQIAEIVARDAEAEIDPEPAGRLELENDSPILVPKTEQAAAPESKPGIFLNIGEKETLVSGDVRLIVKELPKVGAKLDKEAGVWRMPASRTHELMEVCEKAGLPCQEAPHASLF